MDGGVDATGQSTMADDATALAHGCRNPGEGICGRPPLKESAVLESPSAGWSWPAPSSLVIIRDRTGKEAQPAEPVTPIEASRTRGGRRRAVLARPIASCRFPRRCPTSPATACRSAASRPRVRTVQGDSRRCDRQGCRSIPAPSQPPPSGSVHARAKCRPSPQTTRAVARPSGRQRPSPANGDWR